MNPRSLRALAAAFAALAAACGAAYLLTRQAPAARLGPDSLTASAARLDVSGADGELSLRREGSAWKEAATGYPADASMVQEKLEKLGRASLSEPLTEDPQRYALFGLGTSSPTRVRVYAGEAAPLVDFYAGKDGPEYPSVYVRRPKEPGVLLARGLSSGELAAPPGTWLSLVVSSAAPADLTAVSVRWPKTSYELRRAGKDWTVDGAPIPAMAADKALRTALAVAGDLAADRVLLASAAPSRKNMGLDRPGMEVRVATGKAVTVWRVGFKPEAGENYVERVGEGRVFYLVPDWRLDSLRKTPSEFRK